MRHLLLGLALATLSTQAFGQLAFQGTPNFPWRPPTPRTFALNPPSLAGKTLTAPGVALPFRNWQQLLEKSASGPERGGIRVKSGKQTTGWGASGHCSIALLEMPLMEPFDEAMVRKMPPQQDDKMVITPPPVCPLHAKWSNPPRHK